MVYKWPLVLYILKCPKWNSILYSWTCLKMYLQPALLILFSKIESLELLFSNIHPQKFWWCPIRSVSLFCAQETADPFPTITGPFYNFVLLYMRVLARRIFLFSVCPSSLVLQVLSQMSPSIVGNGLSCAPTVVL